MAAAVMTSELVPRLAILSVLLAVAACSPDTVAVPGGMGPRTAAGVGATIAGVRACQDGTMSVPGSAGDPCAGSTVCGTLAGRVVAMCSRGTWGVCSCAPNALPPKPAQVGPVCGNNVIEMGEVCEPAIPVAATCGMLVPGSTGTVSCVDCHYNTQLCTVMNPTVASGTGSSGTGALPPPPPPPSNVGAGGSGPCGGTAQPCCPGFVCTAPNGFCHFDVGICFP